MRKLQSTSIITLVSLFEKFLVIAVFKLTNKSVFILLLTIKGLEKMATTGLRIQTMDMEEIFNSVNFMFLHIHSFT